MNKKFYATFLIIFIFSIFIFYGCVSRVAIKSDYDFSKIKHVGVLGFADYNEQQASGEAVADEFIRQLVKKDIVVIERIQLKEILREQNLGSSGYLSPDTAKKVGDLLGVDVIITGTVTEYLPEQKYMVYMETKTKTIKIKESSEESNKMQKPTKEIESYQKSSPKLFVTNAKVGISARMIDVETGTIVWANSYSYDAFDMQTAIEWAVSDLLRSLKDVWPQIANK